MKDRDRFWDLSNVYRYRNENLAALGFVSYKAYLQSALWKDIRARVFAERGRCCERCQRPATQVHHRSYDPATLRGQDVRSLTVACARCHRKAERPNVGQRSVDRLANANHYLTKRVPRREHWKQRSAARQRRWLIEQFQASWQREMDALQS
jgi:hypothetical protein